MVLALNTVSGQIADISPKMLLHPKFKDILVPVDENAKPYNSAMYKPGTVEEKVEQHASSGAKTFARKKRAKKVEIVEEPNLTLEEVFAFLEEEQAPESNIDIEEEN